MQSFGITLRNIKSEDSLSTRYPCSTKIQSAAPFAKLLIPTSVTAKSDTADIDRPAIASSKVVHPFPMSASAPAKCEPMADNDAAENISFVMSSTAVQGQEGQGNARKVFSRTVVYFAVSEMGPTVGASPATSFSISNAIPDQMSLFVGDLGPEGSGPVELVENDSGLDFAFDGLVGLADALEYSSNNGWSFNYIPDADADGYDDKVTHIRIAQRDASIPTIGNYTRFSMRYKMRAK